MCAGKRISVTNSLATKKPELAAEWHPFRNGSLTPESIVAGSHDAVWWKCDVADDHEWQNSPNRRSAGDREGGCPFCAGRKVSSTNRLSEHFPDIAAQWHPTKNGTVLPSDVTAGTDDIFWWKCDVADDHEWKARVEPRTRRGDGCPFCAGQKVSVSNSLPALYPDVAAQWHPTLNGSLKPEGFTAGSSKKVWWKCDVADDHEWECIIFDRTMGNGSGCPCCGGEKASVTNSLASLSPELSKEWHPTKNGDLTPDGIPNGSGKRVWWACPVAPDHVWSTILATRSIAGTGCPFCAGKRLSVTNALSNFADVAAEWHPTRNQDVTPDHIVHGETTKRWWRCSIDPSHEWDATPSARTWSGTGCPLCTLTPRSAQEIRLAYELSAVIDFDLDQHKVRVNGRLRDVDIVIEPLRLIVEFDGAYWHRNKHDKDAEKTALLEAENWSVIRVRERPLDPVHTNDVMVETLAPPKEVADAVLKKIVSVTGSKFDKLDEYLASTGPWRDEEALAAIKEYQAENAAKKAASDAKRQQRNTSKK